MRRIPLTPFGWSLLLVLVVAGVGALVGASVLAWAAATVFLILLLGALAPLSASHLQVRARVRPPGVPWIRIDDRRPRGRSRSDTER